MQLLAKQPYIKVEREVNSIEQRKIVDERIIYLYDEKIVTRHREFQLSEILDISFRTFGAEGGLLYIHTKGGQFTYTVESSPKAFIEVYEAHIGKR